MKQWLKDKKYYAAAIIAAAGYFVYFYGDKPQPVVPAEPAIVQSAEETNENSAHNTEKTSTIFVDLKGSVHKPGVYSAKSDERVIDMIERAGGMTDNADPSGINFAQKLEDEMVIYIPEIGENPQGTMPAGTINQSGDGKININKADATLLQEIPGIGPAKAEAIIEYREKNGPFKDNGQLKEVGGIGDKTYEKLEGFITVR